MSWISDLQIFGEIFLTNEGKIYTIIDCTEGRSFVGNDELDKGTG